RKGFMSFGTEMGSSAIGTLVEYSNGATRKLLAATNGKIFDASAAGAATELDTGYTNNFWQHTIFNGTMILVNGADVAQQYNGTAISDATYTGSGLTATDLIDVITYRSRLY